LKKQFLFFLIPALLAFDAAVASTADAEKRLQSAVKEFLQTAEKSPNSEVLAREIKPVLEKYLCFDAMTRRAIGPGWRQFSPEDRKQAALLFTDLIIRSYSDKLTPGEYPVFEFKSATTPAKGRVDVPTTFAYKGSKYGVVYRLEKTDQWRITDVVIEGVSFIANYRSQFDAVFKWGGVAAVLSSLEQSAKRSR
jgi:phospholipid transport system substrate-binding protein